MSASAPPGTGRSVKGPRRLAFLGPPAWLDSCCPPDLTQAGMTRRLPFLQGSDVDRALHELQRFDPRVTIVFDPGGVPAEMLHNLPGLTLGIIIGGTNERGASYALAGMDRLVSFRPDLTGTQMGGGRVWRAIPPPISDALFGEVRPLHGRSLAMTIGRSSVHRERMLLPAKHQHDVLQVLHGVTGERLLPLMREYDVGVYVPAAPSGGFGPQVGMHLAAGQLLFAHGLCASHGLERNLDYLQFDTPEELVWALDRVSRFPEMHQRLRIRGRMKAENYRASRLFARLIHDLLIDVTVFGRGRAVN